MDSVRSVSLELALPRLEQHMLWQHVLNVPRAWLIAHDTDVLAPEAVAQFRRLASERLAGTPMAYIIGRREFMGHEFHVTPAVLIPRPETELLVETALEYLASTASSQKAPRILDLGTGSGAIAISLALARPDATVVATDLSAQALDVARQNAKRLGAPVEFWRGNWYDVPYSDKVFDLIVSNPPYIAAADPHLSQGDVRFEPSLALSDGDDGLMALRAIIQDASRHLRSPGAVFVEHGWDQAAPVRRLFEQAGFVAVQSKCDLAGIERVSGGHL